MAGLSSDVVAVYRRLLGYLKPSHRRILTAACLSSVIYAGVGYFVPDVMRTVVEELESAERTARGALAVPLLIILALVIRGVTDFLIVYGLSWVGRAVIRDLRADLFAHYLGLPARFFDRNSTGVLLSRLTYNTEQVADATSNAIVVLLRDSLAIVGATSLDGSEQPGAHDPGRRRRSAGRAARRRDEPRVSALQHEDPELDGRRHPRDRAVAARAARREDLRRSGARAAAVRGAQRAQLSAQRSAGRDARGRRVADAGDGSHRRRGSDLRRVVGARRPYPVAVSRFHHRDGHAVAAAQAPDQRQRHLAARCCGRSRLVRNLDEPLEDDIGDVALERARGDVEYRDVSFGYDPRKGRVLKNLSLVVPAGTSVALVGQSGSGKSTLVGLLPRFYDVDSGAILLDGMDVRRYKLQDLRRQVSLVSQDVVLFDDTIANNIAYGALAVRSRAQIEAAAEAAYVPNSRRSFPTASTRASASAACCSRAGSGSASRLRAHCSRTRPC